MRLYVDYLDEAKSLAPYQNNEELVKECLCMLDLLLESYLDQKGGYPEHGALSRGLVVTDSEIRGYLNTPPYLRGDEERDPLLLSELRKADAHIRMRVKKTGKDVPLPLWELRERCALSEFEFFSVLVALSVQVDLKYTRLYAFLQDDITRKLPTVGLAQTLYSRFGQMPLSGSLQLFSEDGCMNVFLFESAEKDGGLGLLRPLVLRRQLLRWILGGSDIGEDTFGGVLSLQRPAPHQPVFFPETLGILEKVLEKQASEPVIPYLEGPEGTGRTALCARYALERGYKLWVLDLALFTALSEDKAAEIARQTVMVIRLEDAMLLIKNCSGETIMSRSTGTLFRFLQKQGGGRKVVLSGEETILTSVYGVAIYGIRPPVPGVHTRLNIWTHFTKELTLDPEICLAELADCYELSVGTIRRIVEQAAIEMQANGETAIRKKRLLETVFRLNTAHFEHLATPVRSVYGWDDLEISPRQREVLQTACNRYKMRNRIGEDWGLAKKNAYGNGVSILLYGPPGTGKTMAAQVIAGEIGLALYRVDLSQLFSKYIGETEKNLAAVFEEAQKTNVVLFFDEADALFSKRTEINSSNDKYANSETAYLLQKVEEYNGVSILATNLYHHFDAAFTRRITYAVRFDSPDQQTRYKLWTTILPKDVPMSQNIDFSLLAKQFELSGSNIKAILYSAAYMAAADDGGPVTAAHIVKAMQYEFEKLGKMPDPLEFGTYAGYLL